MFQTFHFSNLTISVYTSLKEYDRNVSVTLCVKLYIEAIFGFTQCCISAT